MVDHRTILGGDRKRAAPRPLQSAQNDASRRRFVHVGLGTRARSRSRALRYEQRHGGEAARQRCPAPMFIPWARQRSARLPAFRSVRLSSDVGASAPERRTRTDGVSTRGSPATAQFVSFGNLGYQKRARKAILQRTRWMVILQAAESARRRRVTTGRLHVHFA